MNEFTDSFWDAVPHWLAGAIAVVVFLVYTVTKLAGVHEGVIAMWPKVKGWLSVRGRDNADRNASVDYQIADLWRQVKFLEEQLSELRLRDECYWAWILSDQEWHRKYEFKAMELGWETIPHLSFMEFRDMWLTRKFGRPGDEDRAPF